MEFFTGCFTGFFTVDALNQILLPPFIFLVTFCFLCCQVADPATNLQPEIQDDNSSLKPLNEEENRVEETRALAFESKEIVPIPVAVPVTVPVPVNESLEITQEPLPIEPENHPIESSLSLSEVKVEESAEEMPEELQKVAAALDNLTKRQARKLMGGLGLQQKRNGVELSTELMTANLKREFKNDPKRFVTVVRERLPELIEPLQHQEASLLEAS